MGRERFLFVPSPLPCGSALWDPDLTGRKSWRYSPECVEEEFCELRYNGVLRSSGAFFVRCGTYCSGAHTFSSARSMVRSSRGLSCQLAA
jgi:hypothetical protein